MANFCGGINLSDDFKMLNGVICAADATSVDVSKAITVCGQLWDSATFAVSGKCVTAANAEEGNVEPIKGNCGVGLDGRYFSLANGVVSFTAPVEPEPEEPRGDM